MLPLVLSTGSGSELYRGLGAAVLGGLATSTVFTLILIPVIFSLWIDLQEKLRPNRFMSIMRGGEKGHSGEGDLAWGGNGAAGTEAGQSLPESRP